MRLNPEYELMQIADEYMAVPVGQKADAFHGVIVLNEPAYFLLSGMKETKTKEELITLLTEEYDVDASTANADIDRMIGTLLEAGVIYE